MKLIFNLQYIQKTLGWSRLQLLSERSRELTIQKKGTKNGHVVRSG